MFRGAKKRTFRFGKKNVSFPKVETFRFADYNIEPKSRIRQIIDQWRADPLINMAKEASRHNMHLVYPMLVIFDDKMTVYDDLIMGIISYIQTKYSAVQPTLTIPYTIFFLFFHVDNSRIIKTQVLQWINQKQQLMP